MRLSIRVKQIVGVTAIVGLAVVALSALYTNRLANVVLRESLSRGKMLANTILHRAGGIVTGDVRSVPRAARGSGTPLDS